MTPGRIIFCPGRIPEITEFCQIFMGCVLDGNRQAHRFALSNACKDLRCQEGMANAATVTATMATAAKNSFAVAMAQGGAGPQDCLLHLTDFVSRANGFLNRPLEGLIRMETVPRTHSPTVRGTVCAVNGPVRGLTRPT